MGNNILNTGHVSFDEISEYVFSKTRPVNFSSVAAKINGHVMKCPTCREAYYALMGLKDEIDKAMAYETFDEKIKTRVFAFLYSIEHSKPIKAIVNECIGFEKWLSFNIINLRELSQTQSDLFSHPKLTTIMKSSIEGHNVEETESEIKSSLLDRKGNRVCIGIDGTLSLYFDAADHSIGKRVIILPEDSDVNPQMFELTRYDNSISHVRFEGITSGQYTVVVEA